MDRIAAPRRGREGADRVTATEIKPRDIFKVYDDDWAHPRLVEIA
jgi:hypothetical protein